MFPKANPEALSWKFEDKHRDSSLYLTFPKKDSMNPITFKITEECS